MTEFSEIINELELVDPSLTWKISYGIWGIINGLPLELVDFFSTDWDEKFIKIKWFKLAKNYF